MFGLEEFGKTPFGESSFIRKLYDLWPQVHRDENLKNFMEACEKAFDLIRKYTKWMLNLYDSYWIRPDLLWFLAGNYGLKKSDFWQEKVLRRFIECIGYWVQQKGRKSSVEAILRIFELGGETRWFKVVPLFSLSKRAGDVENYPEIFLSKIGDGKLIGKNKFFSGSWKYLIGEIGWYSWEELQTIPDWDKRTIFGLSLYRIDVELPEARLDKRSQSFILDICRLANPCFVDIEKIKISTS